MITATAMITTVIAPVAAATVVITAPVTATKSKRKRNRWVVIAVVSIPRIITVIHDRRRIGGDIHRRGWSRLGRRDRGRRIGLRRLGRAGGRVRFRGCLSD